MSKTRFFNKAGDGGLSPEVSAAIENFPTQLVLNMNGGTSMDSAAVKKFKQSVKKVSTKLQEDLLQEQLRERLLRKDFDNFIFSDDPKKTSEIEQIICYDNTSFIEYLITFCKSESTLTFWLQNGATWPQDSLAKALHLKASPFVFQRLETDGLFDDISPYEKNEFMKRAKSIFGSDSKSFQCLEEILNRKVKSSPSQRF